jgi:hypothetical protein
MHEEVRYKMHTNVLIAHQNRSKVEIGNRSEVEIGNRSEVEIGNRLEVGIGTTIVYRPSISPQSPPNLILPYFPIFLPLE